MRKRLKKKQRRRRLTNGSFSMIDIMSELVGCPIAKPSRAYFYKWHPSSDG